MKHAMMICAALVFASFAPSADAACYADYKAKKDGPLQLHYGVMELPDAFCNGGTKDAAAVIAQRLRQDGWWLLHVVSLFDAQGLQERKASAGPYFLRF